MPVYAQTYIKAKVREFDGVIKTNFFRWWNTKRKYALRLHCLYNYCFCYEKSKEKLTAGLFKITIIFWLVQSPQNNHYSKSTK